jgi:murein DD-endopeptidase MepM/ murein hydrolase activator NlpD
MVSDTSPAPWRDHPAVQHRATPGRHRRTEALHSHRASRRPARRPATAPAPPATGRNAAETPVTDAVAPSTAPATGRNAAEAPVVPSTAPASGLVEAEAPTTEAAPIPVGPVRAASGPRHRAPAQPIAPALLGERGRHAVMTAALVAGVGVSGVSGATTGAGPARGAVTAQAPTLAAHLPATTASTPVAGLSALTAVDTAAAAAAAAGATTGDAGVTASRFGAAAGGSTANRTAAGTDGPGSDLTAAAPIAGATLGGVRSARKERPVPVVQWVHPMPEGSVTSCFGPRWGRLHAGVDLAAASGTPIRAAGAGFVMRAAAADGYGLAVLIDHGNGYLTHYGHMSALGVVAGQRVTAGQEIGKEGSTGHSTGPHLHFEVHEGGYKNPVEPTAWMLAHGVDLGGCAAEAAGHADHEH